jgi:leader peptidase (prepilin peptidase)/N-methyltransferase
MDSTSLAVLVGAVAAGVGSLLVPQLIRVIPEIDPAAEDGDEQSAAAAAAPGPGEPEDSFAAIADLAGLGWRAAVVGAAAGALLGAGIGWHWPLVMWVPLVPAYVALGLVDWRRRLLPTFVIARLYVVLLALVLVGWAVTRDTGAVVHAALGWLVYGGLFALLWFVYPRGLGFGDVRLAGVLGIALGWLGWAPLLVGIYAGLILGGVLGLVLTLLKVIDRRNNPFGPYMVIGALVGVVWGQPIWSSLAGG